MSIHCSELEHGVRHRTPKPVKASPEKLTGFGLREWKKRQAELEDYQDLRDDIVTLVDLSRMSDELIHERCGPHPVTLAKWRAKETQKPQMGKMRSILRILGKKIAIVDDI